MTPTLIHLATAAWHVDGSPWLWLLMWPFASLLVGLCVGMAIPDEGE